MKPVIRIITALLAFAAFSLQAQQLRSDYPEEYIVRKGDTLWDISGMFLQDPWYWPEIWYVNEQIANPHLIYPGDRLRLVYIDGQPRIVMDRGVVKLEPSIRAIAYEDAISAVSLDAIRDFFSGTRAVSQEELDAAPYVVAGQERRILVADEDELYARGQFLDNVRMYQIFKPGEDYVDPDTDEVLGVRAEVTGLARYQSMRGEVATLGVEESYKEISIGHVLLPLVQDEMDPSIFPEVPPFPVDGTIINVEGGVTNVGQFDVVAVNRGTDHGLVVGNLLGVMIRGELVRDQIADDKVQLPDELGGLMIIFKAHPSMSFGLILESQRPLSVGDKISNEF